VSSSVRQLMHVYSLRMKTNLFGFAVSFLGCLSG
jgi:hypothetical protein